MIKEFIAKKVEQKLNGLYVHRTNKFHKKSIFEKWHDKRVKKFYNKLRKSNKDKTFTFCWFLAKNLQNDNERNNVICSIADFFRDTRKYDLVIRGISDIVVLGKTIFVYTRRPGIFIGKCGSVVDGLVDKINHNLKGEKIRDYTITIIEDTNSGIAELYNWISFNLNNY